MKPGILGIGSWLPKKIVSNADLVNQGLDTSDDWIVSRTGIRSRHIASPDDTTASLATLAGRQALDNAGIAPNDLGMIIVATSTPDYAGFPAVATQVQSALGCLTCPAWDLSAACSGFVFALDIAQHYPKPVLIIGADILSRRVNWTDRRTCILFGDGAGAAVIGPVQTGGIIASVLYTDGAYADILTIPADHSGIQMAGPAVFKLAIQCIVPCVETVLDKANLKPSDIDWFVPHQANSRIIDHAATKLGIPHENRVQTIQDHGNTSAASIPIALDTVRHKFKSGDVIVLVGFGAGFTWGASVILWS